jgi:RimJ/RimL family protein N-acetyltransferase
VEDERRLLETEIDTIYGLTPVPRAQPRRLATPDVAFVFGWSPNARVIAVSHAAAELVDTLDLNVAEQFAPESEPSIVTMVKERLLSADPASGVTASGGPSYVFPPTIADLHASLPIILSDAIGLAEARRLQRPDNWQVGEWDQLISGEIGQWAMAVDGLQPVSICHTPVATASSAEAGVWTRADHRGAGLAGAVTAAWWRHMRADHRILFYSTRSDNAASRAVARKLGLVPLGWLWTVK